MQQETSPIDHGTVVTQRLIDKYLLKELSAVQAEEFERHYFECAECAGAVESGEILIANAREVLREMPEEAQVAKSAGWFSGFSWAWRGMLMPATAMALAAVCIYQGAVVIPRLNQPRILPAFQLLGASRGVEEARVVPAGAAAFVISGDIPPDAHAQKYLCQLQTNGRTVFSLDAPPPAPGQPVTILVPVKGLRSGSYELYIYAGRERVFDSSFEIRFQ